MSLGEEISKIVEEEADHLPKETEVRVLLKQKIDNGHVTLLGVHPDVESAKLQATRRIRNTENHQNTVLDWTVRDNGINVSQNLDVGKGAHIKYVILSTTSYPTNAFQETT